MPFSTTLWMRHSFMVPTLRGSNVVPHLRQMCWTTSPTQAPTWGGTWGRVMRCNPTLLTDDFSRAILTRAKGTRIDRIGPTHHLPTLWPGRDSWRHRLHGPYVCLIRVFGIIPPSQLNVIQFLLVDSFKAVRWFRSHLDPLKPTITTHIGGTH